ncbi:MAG: acetate--CoA ligase family protein [Deltaproteobacteria bacterium]|nr:acetate--CoA ligase family protein [Deltaproteobacteria bacterium]
MTIEVLHMEQKQPTHALNEYVSKQLIQQYGIPVVSEILTETTEEAVSAARKIGFPVVIKGIGATLLHKTERGLVHLDLDNEKDVERAVRSVVDEAGDELEGVLVQSRIEGKREFVAGLFRDELFGPAVMFGLGGVFAEALSDVSFRVAPLAESDAREMIHELAAQELLGEFRGDRSADEDQLIQTLMGLSRLAMDHPEITEIDINPLIVSPDGAVCAVDALVVKGEPAPNKKARQIVDPARLGQIFHPRSVAFVGASAQLGKWGQRLVVNTLGNGYQGTVYLVNPKGGTLFGRPVYRSVEELPEPVELGVVTIPAAKVADLIPQFAARGIRHMLLITSGFGEVGEEGKRLEQDLLQKAEAADIVILGPNTMGICNPHTHFYCTGALVTPKPGGTTILAQSGNMGVQLMGFAEQEDIGIRAYCGSGNESMITIESYLAAFEQDNRTRAVAMYVEGVKDGRQFLDTARRVTQKKPVVLLKGGRSQAGSKAAASHTGSLSSDAKIFDAVCRQAGIVTVTQPVKLLDLAAAFSSLPLPRGNRLAVMTLGGGWGVVTADLCSDYGIQVPELSANIVKQLDAILTDYWSRANPVDLVGENDFNIPLTIAEALIRWDGCDAVINLGIMGRGHMVRRAAESTVMIDPDMSPDLPQLADKHISKFEKKYIEHLVRLMETYHKPVFGVSLMKTGNDKTLYEVEGSEYKGIFFQTPERAVKAFSKMCEYRRFLSR